MQNKLALATEWIRKGCAHLGLQPDVEVIDIQHNRRWICSYEQDPNYPDFGRGMIKLERWVKGQISRPVELLCEATADRNKRVKRWIVVPPKLRGVESLD